MASFLASGSVQTFLREDSEVVVLAVLLLFLGLLATRRPRLAAGLFVAGAAVAAVVLFAQREPGISDEARAHAKRLFAEDKRQHDRVARWVREGKLPPAALEMFPLHGESDPDIVPRPDGDGDANDVIHVGGDRTRGKKLQWDLDGNGRITKSERTLTEEELWTAAETGGREAPRKHRIEPDPEEGLRPA